MTTTVVALVLAAALLHSMWNALAKSGGSPAYSIAAYQMVGTVVCLFLIWFVPFPDQRTWGFILASVIVHNFYYFTLAKAYLSGDLSLVYPLFRGLAPVLVVAGAALFAAEYLPVPALFGIGLVSLGLLLPALFGARAARPSRPALVWGLITSLLIAAYTVIDGAGVRSAETGFSYIVWLFFLESLPICIWLICFRRQQWFAYLNNNKAGVVFGGIASSTAYGMVIYALSLAPMALVSSLRETSVVFAAIIGAVFLGEGFGRQRIFAAMLVAAGVVVIRYFAAN